MHFDWQFFRPKLPALGPHGWRQGLARIPLHVVTWGAAGAIAAFFFGAWGVVPFVAMRVQGEIQDWLVDKTDTPAKAAIDFVSQVAPALVAWAIAAIFR
jgi:hypothetical protein